MADSRYQLAYDIAKMFEEFDPYGARDSLPDTDMTIEEGIEWAARETVDNRSALEWSLDELETMAADRWPGDPARVQALRERFDRIWNVA